MKVSTVTLSKWECEKVYPVWKNHARIIEYLGYDPFPSCGLQDPYSNEPPFVAILSPAAVAMRLRNRRLELKLTLAECAQNLGVSIKTLRAWERGKNRPCRKHRDLIAELETYSRFQKSV